MPTENQRIAETILQQLGGSRRLSVMTGARNFIAVNKGVTFRVPSPQYNYVRIILNTNDYYDVEFLKVRKTSIIRQEKLTDVCVDDLRSVFTENTGLYLSL